FWTILLLGFPGHAADENSSTLVYILPIREDIMPPLKYLVRRGVKEAMEAEADLLILDMETNGGRVDITEEIIEIIGRFPNKTITYVNKKAYSAGAFISVATQEIYMAPVSVIGAAAPIMMSPGGMGTQEMPSTMEVKITSAISALIRANAEKNNYNVDVIEAMIDKSKELVIDGEVLCEKGQILTLNNSEAEREYGNPPQRLLSSGTVENIESLLQKIGISDSVIVHIEPTGAEELGTLIHTISPILLIIGIVGLYIEFKTPGFGVFGIAGIAAFILYFLGSYVSGLSGMEWLLVFFVGVILIGIELFLFPGTIVFGLLGASIILCSLIMGMVDIYPGSPNPNLNPNLPSIPDLTPALANLWITMLGSGIIIFILSRYLPKTSAYHQLISNSASGVACIQEQMENHESMTGRTGRTISVLAPGGKARFGDAIIDVISDGELIEKGQAIRIIRFNGPGAIVESV
ncbi:MAG TPA: hypothetical protein EYG38_15505, partial [Verrucomicrobia bacterium]|nr:hypothetical protein [Verrucomicrobiota bacterium]